MTNPTIPGPPLTGAEAQDGVNWRLRLRIHRDDDHREHHVCGRETCANVLMINGDPAEWGEPEWRVHRWREATLEDGRPAGTTAVAEWRDVRTGSHMQVIPNPSHPTCTTCAELLRVPA